MEKLCRVFAMVKKRMIGVLTSALVMIALSSKASFMSKDAMSSAAQDAADKDLIVIASRAKMKNNRAPRMDEHSAFHRM